MEFLVRHMFQGKEVGLVALSNLVNKVEALESPNVTPESVLDYHFMIVLWIMITLVMVYFALHSVRHYLEIKKLKTNHLTVAMQDQKSWLHMIITSANRSISVTLCRIDLPLTDILYAQSNDSSFPKLSFCGFRPTLDMDFGFLNIVYFANNDIKPFYINL